MPCFGYKWLSESDRNEKYSGGNRTCDNSLPTGWYRFGGGAGNKMRTSCGISDTCGAHAPGWMNGIHPTSAQGKVTRSVCFHYHDGTCCKWSNYIKVINCGHYYVYKLSQTPSTSVCDTRYCGSD